MLRAPSTDLIRSVGNLIRSTKSDTKHLSLDESQIVEWIRCRENILYYIFNYVKFETAGNNIDAYNNGTNFHLKFKRYVRSIYKYHTAVLMASRQLGKALDISTPLSQPTGSWTTIGSIKEGDYLYGADGKPTKVIAVTDIMIDRPTYEIEFDNSDKIKCDENHLWLVNNTSFHIENKIMSTKEIFEKTETLKTWSQAVNFSIKIIPVVNRTRQLYIDPYLLGLWLGDGASSCSRLSCSLEDYPLLKSLLNDRGYNCGELKLTNKTGLSGSYTVFNDFHKTLRKMKLLDNKHIPREYLYADIEQRLELLRGLLDSDGFCNKNCGTVQFYQKKFSLLSQVRELLASLGVKTRLKSRIINEQTYYTLTFTTNKYRVFNLERKSIRQIGSGAKKENYSVFIKTIKKCESVPVRCIQVDAKDGMFLCGKTMIPTHNSTINAAILSWSTIFFPKNTAIILNFKKEAALENLKKIKFIVSELPDFLKLETTSKSDIKTYADYSNGSNIKVFYPTTVHTKETIARSLSSPILYVDEPAFIPEMANVFGSAQPILSKAREQAAKNNYPYFIALSCTPKNNWVITKILTVMRIFLIAGTS